MTARITSRQKQQAQKFVGDTHTSINPTKEGMQRVLVSKSFQARFKDLIIELAAEYFLLLSDNDAVVWIVEYVKKSEAEARQAVEGLRQKVRAHGVADSVKIHAEVRPGCLFKRDIPQMGPCWEDFRYLQDWVFPDPPTEHCLVSWIPVPLADSTAKSVSGQTAAIVKFKAEAGLPAWYEFSFGSVNHISGLALAHFNATGKDPFNGLVVRTDTCRSDGYRLKLDWDQGRLYCDIWRWDGDSYPSLAVFALGVVKALGR